jgi:hypothetical protein
MGQIQASVPVYLAFALLVAPRNIFTYLYCMTMLNYRATHAS